MVSAAIRVIRVFRGLSSLCALCLTVATGQVARGQQYAFTNFVGMPGGSGNADGTGSVARFNAPQGLAVDRAGNVYVADTYNYTIRKVNGAGEVTTLAGSAGHYGSVDGPGSAARFCSPMGVAVDGAGNVFVGDSWDNTIRRMDLGGVVTTLAGSAGNAGSANGPRYAAQFNGPTGVAVDSAGNVYEADTGNSIIRKVTPAGVVTTLAGNAGKPGYADGTGSAARFSGPSGVAVDSAGNVHVADRFNRSIRKVNPAGVVTTLAGSTWNIGSADGTSNAAWLSGPSGLAVDPAGNVYVADQGNNTIWKVSLAGVVATLAGSAENSGNADGVGSAAQFDHPQRVAVDRAGYVYVADQGNNTIRKVSPAGAVTTVAGSVGNAGSADGRDSASRFHGPSGVVADGAGNLFVADTGNHTIRQVNAAGVVTTLAGSAGNAGNTDGVGSAAQFSGPSGVAVDSAGNLYVA